jgi:toxin-antitoxin system PIN domain toxin
MMVPDTNLLVYAYDSESPFHPAAKIWWQNALSGREPIGVPWVVILGFTRIMSHPSICTQPLGTEVIRGIVNTWIDRPQVRILSVSGDSLPRFFDLLHDIRLGGNLTTDALIALHAFEHSATVYSTDHDFNRFPGLKWVNPLKDKKPS